MIQLSDKRKAELLAGPYTRLLAEHEGAMADLYKDLAGMHPSSRAFWEQMSREECLHQNMVSKMEEKFQNGEWKFKRPDFITSAIMDSLNFIALQRKNMETQGISMREALKMAVNMEEGMVESNYFAVLDGDNAEMMDMLQTQTAFTRAHVLRLKKEARRLKWKITGGKRVRLVRTATTMSRENIQASIKTSQSNMLGLLISMEEAISKLYVTYGDKFKDAAKFWGILAAEEMQHAAMLRQLYKILDKGKLFYSIDHFDRASIEKMIECVITAEYNANHRLVTHKMALSIAIQTERCMTESGFYRTVTSDAPEYKIIAEQLIIRTDEHIARIEEELKNCTDKNTWV